MTHAKHACANIQTYAAVVTQQWLTWGQLSWKRKHGWLPWRFMGGCHGNIGTTTMGTDTGTVAIETNTAMAATVKNKGMAAMVTNTVMATMVTDTGMAVMVTR